MRYVRVLLGKMSLFVSNKAFETLGNAFTFGGRKNVRLAALNAYLSALHCGVGGQSIHQSDFTSDPATCLIYTSLDSAGYWGLEGLQERFPDARIARNNATFVILDETGESTISNIQLD
jgi:hypothetical protein